MARVEAPLLGSCPLLLLAVLPPAAVLTGPGAEVLRVVVVPVLVVAVAVLLEVVVVVVLVAVGASGAGADGRFGYNREEVWVTQLDDRGTRAT